jgi:hypothetical protein
MEEKREFFFKEIFFSPSRKRKEGMPFRVYKEGPIAMLATPTERHHLLSFTLWSSSLRYASLHCVPSPTVRNEMNTLMGKGWLLCLLKSLKGFLFIGTFRSTIFNCACEGIHQAKRDSCTLL